MNRSFLPAVVILLSAAFASTNVRAAGFRLPDQSASALGMAGAFVAQADDASAAWYNPAGIALLPGTRVAAGVVGIYPVMTHETASDGTEASRRSLHLPPHVFATGRLSPDSAIGISITSPFGLSSDWRTNSSVRYVSTFSRIETIEVNPCIAIRPSDRLSLAVGAAYLHLKATMEKLLPLVDANFRLDGDGDGWGFNAAVLYAPTDRTRLGLTYRSRIKVKIDGTADIGAPLSLSNPARTEITLPDIVQLGISHRATERLTVNTDLEYTFWSTYDRLVVTSGTVAALTGGATDTQTIEKQWKDAWCLRTGGQYDLPGRWKLRAGLLYDRTPVPESHFDTAVPDADRYGVTAGAGYTAGRVTVDAAYMYLRFAKRTIRDSSADDLTPDPAALNGTYRSLAHVAAITIGYTF